MFVLFIFINKIADDGDHNIQVQLKRHFKV